METSQKAVHEFGVFSSRVKSIYDETVTCFQEIKQTLPLNESEGDKDVLSTAALSEVQRALRKNPSVIFIGDRNCGKSSLLNEVLGGSYLPVHENPCTSRIVRIVFAEETYAELITRDGRVIETKFGFKKIPREFAVMSDADIKEGEKLQCTVKVGLNHELLRSGIELIYSPGRNENDELDSVLDKFLGDGTVPLIVYIIDGGTGLRKTDLKTINLLQEKFPQVSFMFVCNKVDTTSGASDYDRDSGDEDKDQVNAKELSVFHKLKAAKIIPSKAVLGSYPYFHAVSAKETKEARYKNEHNKATQMFQRFEKCLKENLEAAIKRDTKRAVDKLLVLQESFVTGVNIAHDKQKEETQSIRLQHIPDIFGEILNAEAALKNTLATLAANQQGMQSLIENKLRSLEQNFMRKAEQYEILSEGNIRGDVEKSTMQVGSPEVAFKILYSVYELNLPFARFVKDMRETILSETFNTLKDPLLQKINDPLAIASKTIMSLSEKLQHPAVSQIFQESYHIDFKENRDQGDQLLLDVLEDLFDSIGKIVTVAFRREISGPLSEVLPFGSGHGQIGQDIKDKENRREVVKVLLSRIDSRHVSEALIKECRDLFENMHDMLGKALLNLLNFVDVLSKDITSTQLKDLWDVHTPKVRALAIKGFALQFLMKKGPAELGDPVFCMCPTQIYECLSPHWSHCGMPSIVKVVEKSKVNDEVWKRISVDLINTWNISGRYGRVHPNLLRIHGWLMPHDDVLHIVMERAQTDLLTALHRRMSLEKRLKVAADVAQGLKAMHKVGYVYQDLKPETVLLMADGTAKINMAIPVRPLEETRLGCPFHISSEMYRDYNTGISLCSYDIYAFGMLLWVLCEGTGETRPQAFSRCLTNSAMQNAVDDGVVPERPPEATDACWDLMMKCWKNPESVKIDEILDLFQNGEGPATRDTTVPIEIWTRGHKALRAYQKALKDGATYDRRVPVMIVGQDRSGKTSLKKSFKGEEFNPDEGSTNGIETCVITTEVLKAGESVDSTESLEGKIARAAARLTLENLKEQSQEPQKDKISASPKLRADADAPSSSKREESNSGKLSALSASVPRTDSKLPKSNSKKPSPLVGNRAERIPSKPEGVKKLHHRESGDVESSSDKIPKDVEDLLLNGKSEDLETDSAPELIFWDFAGQSVFYTTHSLFLSRKAIYILTYDLSKDLDAKAEPTVKIDKHERKLPDSECGMTNMDYVHYWLSSIHAFSEDSDSRGGESEDLPPKLPAVFLVGTHADECKDPKAVVNQIMEKLEGKPYKDHVVREVFTVNNTLSGKGEGDDEVKRLWDKIQKVAQKLPHMNEEIPLKWWLLEKDLKKFKDDGTNFTRLEDVRQKTHAVCNDDGEDHFRTVLDFFHDRHVVLHFDSTPQLDELVVLSHQWLIDIFKEVITVPRKCRQSGFEKEWNALQEKGELHLELVKHVWKDLVPKGKTISSLLELFQKFSLTCEWVQSNGSKVHLVPSMLMSKADSKIWSDISSAKVPALVVRFLSEYVPFGLFPRLITRCQNWSPTGLKHKMFKNCAYFFWDRSRCYQVVLASRLHKLYCGVITEEKGVMSKRNLTTVCREVNTFLKNELEEMKKEHLWMKGMDYTFCFECPRCSKRGGKLDQCLHYLTEDEIVDNTQGLVCDKSDSLVMETISREEFVPWLETLESEEDPLSREQEIEQEQEIGQKQEIGQEQEMGQEQEIGHKDCPEPDSNQENYTSHTLQEATYFIRTRKVLSAITKKIADNGLAMTGFAISKCLFMSTQNVLKLCCKGTTALFDYCAPSTPNAPEASVNVKEYQLQPDTFYYENIELDYAIVAMSELDGRPGDSSTVGKFSLAVKAERALTCALTGALMFNGPWRPVGIHQGFANKDMGQTFFGNYGRKMIQILKDLYSQPGKPLTEFEEQLKGKEYELGLPFKDYKYIRNFRDCSKDDKDGKKVVRTSLTTPRSEPTLKRRKNEGVCPIHEEAAAFQQRFKECVRVLVYGRSQNPIVTFYVFSDDGISDSLIDEAHKRFDPLKVSELKFVDLSEDVVGVPYVSYPLGFQTLSTSVATDIAKTIKANLELLSQHSNITLVHPSFKIKDFLKTDTPCIAVHVLGKGRVPLGESRIPCKIGEIAVDVLEGFWFDCNSVRGTQKNSFPLELGVSIGLERKYASGTLGAIVEDKKDEDAVFLLSCNHVLKDGERGEDERKHVSDVQRVGTEGDEPQLVAATEDEREKQVQEHPKEEEIAVVFTPASAQPVEDAEKEEKQYQEHPKEEEIAVASTPASAQPVEQKQPLQQAHDVIQPSLLDNFRHLKELVENYKKQLQPEIDPVLPDVVGKNKEDLHAEFIDLQTKKNEAKVFSKTALSCLKILEESFEQCYSKEPRAIASYVTGLQGNFTFNNGEDSYFIDAGLAKLHKKEVEKLKKVQLASKRVDGRNKMMFDSICGLSELGGIERDAKVYKCGSSTELTSGTLLSQDAFPYDQPTVRCGCGKPETSTFHVLFPNYYCTNCAKVIGEVGSTPSNCNEQQAELGKSGSGEVDNDDSNSFMSRPETCVGCRKRTMCKPCYPLRHYYCEACALSNNLTLTDPQHPSSLDNVSCNGCRMIKKCRLRQLTLHYLCRDHSQGKTPDDPNLEELQQCEGCEQGKRKKCLRYYEEKSPVASGVTQVLESAKWRHNCLLVRPFPDRPFAEGGDSGAVIFDDRKKAVGLLFACLLSTTLQTTHTLACPMELVLRSLEKQLGENTTLQLKTSFETGESEPNGAILPSSQANPNQASQQVEEEAKEKQTVQKPSERNRRTNMFNKSTP